MGIYFDTTTDKEDWNYIQKLINNGEAQYKDNKIYRILNEDNRTEILWENCSISTKETFPGEEPPKQTPWGIGKFTRLGCNYIFRQLTKERYSSTL